MSHLINPAVAFTAFSGPTADASSASRDEATRLHRACQDFEAIMLKTMLKEMRSTVPADGLLGGGNEREMFEDLMDQEVATRMARTQGVGIAENLFRQLEKGLSSRSEK